MSFFQFSGRIWLFFSARFGPPRPARPGRPGRPGQVPHSRYPYGLPTPAVGNGKEGTVRLTVLVPELTVGVVSGPGPSPGPSPGPRHPRSGPAARPARPGPHGPARPVGNGKEGTVRLNIIAPERSLGAPVLDLAPHSWPPYWGLSYSGGPALSPPGPHPGGAGMPPPPRTHGPRAGRPWPWAARRGY